jgi:hypothetical protein
MLVEASREVRVKPITKTAVTRVGLHLFCPFVSGEGEAVSHHQQWTVFYGKDSAGQVQPQGQHFLLNKAGLQILLGRTFILFVKMEGIRIRPEYNWS